MRRATVFMNPATRYVRLRAPAEDGQTLAVPPVDDFDEVLRTNHEQWLDGGDCDLQGRSLRQLAAEAREQLLGEALRFTRTYCDPGAKADPAAPLVLTGHQPEIVHAGVWLKNFTAAALAARHGGTAVNLIIDSDLCRLPAIRVPTGSVRSPRVELVPYDRPYAEIPLEQRPLVDADVWQSFGSRVHEMVAPLVPNPLVREWWADCAEQIRGTDRLGLSIARARHQQEMRWHTASRQHSLEIPQSHICRLPAFRWFAAHLLAHLPRFMMAHNQSLADYRREHDLRNHAQPVPDLAEVDGWLETPFWIWSDDAPERRALFARSTPNGLQLSDRHGFEQSLPISDDSPADAAVDVLDELEQRGVKLRTRALLTTLFARLVLSDLFIHGIGGAKYDQVTDAMALRFFGQVPPAFLTISGTLRLPIDYPKPDGDRPRAIAQLLREMEYQPERHVDFATLGAEDRQRAVALVEQKWSAIESPKTSENAARRHLAIEESNRQLHRLLIPRGKELEQERKEMNRQNRANRILGSREFAFCLFPQDHLSQFLLDFARSIP